MPRFLHKPKVTHTWCTSNNLSILQLQRRITIHYQTFRDSKCCYISQVVQCNVVFLRQLSGMQILAMRCHHSFSPRKDPVVKASKDMSINTQKEEQVYLSDFLDPRRWVKISWRMKHFEEETNASASCEIFDEEEKSL